MATKKPKADNGKTPDRQTGKKLLAQRIDTLTAIVENMGIRQGDLKRELARLDSAHAGLAEAAGGLQQHLDGLAGKNGALEDAMAQVLLQVRDAEKRLDDRIEGLAAAREIRGLQDGLKGVQRRDEQARSDLAGLAQRLEVLESALAASGGRSDELQQQFAALAEREDSLDTRSGETKRRLDTLAGDLDTARRELERFGQRLAGVEITRGEDPALPELERKLDGFEGRLAGLIEAQHALERDNRGLRDQLGTADSGLAGLRHDAAALAARLGELEGMSRRIAELDARTMPLLREQAQQQESLSALASRLEASDRARAEAEEAGRSGLAGLREQVEARTVPLAREQAQQQESLSELASRLEASDRARAEAEEAGRSGLAGLREQVEARAAPLAREQAQQQESLSALASRLEASDRARAEAEEAGRSGLAGLREEVEARTAPLAREQAKQQESLSELASRLQDLNQARTESAETERGALAELKERLEARTVPLAREQALQQKSLGELAARVEEQGRTGAESVEAGRSALAELKAQLEAIERNVSGLDGHQRRLAEQVAEASGNLQGLQGSTRELAGRIAELAELSRRLEAVETRTPLQDQELTALQGRVDSTDGAARETARRLEEEVERNRSLHKQIGAVLERLETLGRAVAANDDRLRSLDRELAGAVASQGHGEQETQRLRTGLEERLQEVRQGLEGLSGRFAPLDERVAADTRRLEELDAVLHGLADRTAGLEELSRRCDGLTQSQERQGGVQEELRRRLEGLETATRDLTARRAGEEADIKAREDRAGVDRARLQALGLDAERQRGEAAALAVRVGGLETSDRDRRGRVDEIAGQVSRQARRSERLERAVEENADNYRKLEAELDKAEALLENLREDEAANTARIAGARSGLRVAVWSSVAMAVVLLVVIFAAWRLGETRRLTDRASVAEHLDRLERSVAARRAQETAPDIGGLRTGMAELRSAVRELRTATRNTGSAVPELQGRVDGIAAQQERLRDAVGELGSELERMAEIKPPASRAGDAPPRPETAAPEGGGPAAVQTGAAGPVPEPADTAATPAGPWRDAQRQGHYTIQLLGVRERATLEQFVRRHRPGGDLAYLETRHQGLPWFVLFRGIYPSQGAAARALKALPAAFSGAWVRRLPGSGTVVAIQ